MSELIIHTISRTPGCGSDARRLLERDLVPRVPDRVLDDARTVVSELVNNAYVHGSGEIELRLSRSGERLRVEVVDQGSGAAVNVRKAGAHGGGQGLRIVQALSLDWGAFEGTTHVWADLSLEPQ
ncbi:MAG TPA: ATP-binding protein [Solirubrobacteraceae bacterium]|nr:ATP-binding protein [Solirubrobacteraceae bacterium]